jgi:hypothetical protein
MTTFLVAIVIVPLRNAPGFAATVKFTVPEPDPDPVTVIHEAVVAAVHEQPACVVTVIVELSPVGGEVRLVGATV